MRCLNQNASPIMTGMIETTIRLNRQLMVIIKMTDVMILRAAQMISIIPQVTSSEIRPESEVTRDIIQPTGVLSKYENDSSWR